MSSRLRSQPRAGSHISAVNPSPLSTQASPTTLQASRNYKEYSPLRSQDDICSEDALGQFSYAPATQTTVVTTTTTTTTNFPPLKLKAPQRLHSLDPKQYPLAASPTPYAIRKLRFDLEGTPTIFEEADDTLDTVQKVMSIKQWCVFEFRKKSNSCM